MDSKAAKMWPEIDEEDMLRSSNSTSLWSSYIWISRIGQVTIH